MSIIKKFSIGGILNNFSWLLAQKIVQLVSSFVVGILLARYFGAANYGVYSVVLAIVTVAGSISTFGLNHLVTKEIKSSTSTVSQVIFHSALIRFFAALLSIILFSIVAYFSLDKQYLSLVAIVLFMQSFSCLKVVEFYFLSKSNLKPYIITNVLLMVVSISLKLIFVYFNFSMNAFIYLIGTDFVLMGTLSYVVYLNYSKTKPFLKVDRATFINLARKGFPLALSSLTAVVYLKLDLIMLSYFESEEEVGRYAVASRLSEVWYVFPTLVASAIFPRILELKKTNLLSYNRGIDKVLYFLSFTAFSLSLFVYCLADIIIFYLFGTEYEQSADILRIHIWASVFIFMRAVASKWFIAEDLYYLSLVTHAAGAVSNIILNLLLIPKYGGVGAAIATLISYAFASYLSLFFSEKGRVLAFKMTKALFWPTYFLNFKTKV